VSICCATYNHRDFIAQAIETFLMQETTFPVEVIIRDDASTDGTTDIIRSYETRYPHLISVIYETDNQYSRGYRATPAMMLKASGKYIALCEGDDYWIRRDKLDLQVNCFQNHPETALVFTEREVIGTEGYRVTGYKGSVFSVKDVSKGLVAFTQTMMFPSFPGLPAFLDTHQDIYGDMLISYYCSLQGPIRCLAVRTACYRQTGCGIWSSMSAKRRAEERFMTWCRFHRKFYGGSSSLLASMLAPEAAQLMLKSTSVREALHWARTYMKKTDGGLFRLYLGFVRYFVSQIRDRPLTRKM